MAASAACSVMARRVGLMSSSLRWNQYEADRRAEIVRGLGLILGRRPSDRLVDAIWAIASPEVFAKLVMDRGWSLSSYERWLVDTVRALLGSTGP
jgi:hypothetical protein